MPATFDLEVVAADRTVFKGPAISVVLPGADGYLGVLHGHAPLVTALTIGEITITLPDNQQKIIAVSGGFAEVLQQKTVILAEAAELAEEIDIERARQAQQRAEERLRTAAENIDVDRAKIALLRAINRLQVATRAI